MNKLTINHIPENEAKNDVSVIIVNYNTKSILRECLKSVIEKTSDIDYEIIVVDNASSDGSIDMLRQEFPDALAIEAGDNLGFGRANNLGMSKASGKYLFLLNSDTILLNNTIRIFYDRAEQLAKEGYKIGTLGAILLNNARQTCHSYGSFITPASEFKDLISKYLRFLKNKTNTNPQRIEDVLEVDYITGADMFLPAEVFRKTGGFDPDFFMYCEEVDWQKRMEEAGYMRLVIDGPEIVHLEGGSETGDSHLWSPSRLTNIYTSRKIYRKKHYGKLKLPLFRILYFILDLPFVLGITLKSKRKECLRLIKLK